MEKCPTNYTNLEVARIFEQHCAHDDFMQDVADRFIKLAANENLGKLQEELATAQLRIKELQRSKYRST